VKTGITRREFLRVAAGSALATALPFPLSLAAGEAGDSRPNIIFILADDLGYGDLGCFGQEHIKTPCLDTMCRQGVKFSSHYSGSTVCAPSRYALMTGLHMGHARSIGQGQELVPDEQTLGRVMKKAGYRTACIGKWGLGARSGHPNKQGFDHWFGFLSQSRAHHYYTDYVWRNRDKVELKDNPVTRKQYVHDLFTEEALTFVKESREKPFFLYLPYTIPHAEVLVPEDSQKPYIGKLGDRKRGPVKKRYSLSGYNQPRYPRAARAGMISRMDRDIGRIRALLEELKIGKNTLVVFSSDNGHTRAGGQDVKFFNSGGGLRGAKRTLYEGGIRVPTIACWPGRIRPGAVTDHPSAFWDWLPTFAELAGTGLAGPVDGVSLVPSLLGSPGKQKKVEYLFWDYSESRRPSQVSAIRRGKWKLVVHRKKGGNSRELFDLSADVKESKNLADAHPDVAKELFAAMQPLWKGPAK
jgi:arylsulfatase A-like enzyme